MALWQRRGDLEDLVHRSERGIQDLAIGGAERLAEAAVKLSMASFGDAYDDALAETSIGLYKTELISKHGPGKGIAEVDYATLEWLDWLNLRRLPGPIGNIPPAELEEEYYRQSALKEQEALKQLSLH